MLRYPIAITATFRYPPHGPEHPGREVANFRARSFDGVLDAIDEAFGFHLDVIHWKIAGRGFHPSPRGSETSLADLERLLLAGSASIRLYWPAWSTDERYADAAGPPVLGKASLVMIARTA